MKDQEKEDAIKELEGYESEAKKQGRDYLVGVFHSYIEDLKKN